MIGLNNMQLSFVILNYSSAGLTRNLVENILNLSLDFDFEILVGDNNSKDNLEELLEPLMREYSNIHLFLFEKNDGYSAGNNRLIKKAKGKYVCLLNPDIIIKSKEDIYELLDYLENHHDIAVISPALVYANGYRQQSYFRYYNFLTPFYRRTILGKTNFGKKDLARFTMADVKIEGPICVEWLMGSFWLFRKEIFEKLAYFDERYRLYFEDIDFCHRANNASYKICYYPEVEAIHLHARDSKSENFIKTLFNKLTWIHLESAMKYFWKFYKIKKRKL